MVVLCLTPWSFQAYHPPKDQNKFTPEWLQFESQAADHMTRIPCPSMPWKKHGAFLFKVKIQLERDQGYVQEL